MFLYSSAVFFTFYIPINSSDIKLFIEFQFISIGLSIEQKNEIPCYFRIEYISAVILSLELIDFHSVRPCQITRNDGKSIFKKIVWSISIGGLIKLDVCAVYIRYHEN